MNACQTIEPGMSDLLIDGEIEITPQMIEAGICEAMTHPGEPLAETVSAIYAAMEVERLAKPMFGLAGHAAA